MNTEYIHGTHGEEQDRLKLLNQLTNQPFLKFLELEHAGRVLEVGSGLGILAEEVARMAPGMEVVGVEYAEEQLNETNSTMSNLRFVKGDAESLPFTKEYFDVVYCRYLLEHVAHPDVAVREMRRVLKTSGQVFIQENNILINDFHPTCPKFREIWKKFALLQEKIGGDATIGKKLFLLLKNAGFKNIKLSIQPEVHHAGQDTFKPWINNLIGNVKGAKQLLVKYEIATQEEIDEALKEAADFAEGENSSAYFYWNRAKAVK